MTTTPDWTSVLDDLARPGGRRASSRPSAWTTSGAEWPGSSPPASCPAPPPTTSRDEVAFAWPAELPEARSVVVAATPRPLTRATLSVGGERARDRRAAALRRLPHGAGRARRGAGDGAGAVGPRRRALRTAAQDARRLRGAGALRTQQHRLRPGPRQLPHAGGVRHGRAAARATPPGTSRGSWTAASAAAPACAPAPAAPSAPTGSSCRPTAASPR